MSFSFKKKKKLEETLCVWLVDETEKWLPVSGAVMREKARASAESLF